MPVLNLNYQGINRAVSDYGNAGSCEELINLRPTTQGLVPVKAFTTKMSSITYAKVFVHKAGSRTNYIGVKKVSGSHSTQKLQIDLLTESGGFSANIDQFTMERTIDFETDLHYAYVGNYILFSICFKGGNVGLDNGWYVNKAYLWNGSEYEEREADIPDVTLSVGPSASDTDSVQVKTAAVSYDHENGESLDEIARRVDSALNKIEEENKTLCFGPILVATAFKTTDGKTFWTGNWTLYDPTPHIMEYAADSPSSLDASQNTFINETNGRVSTNRYDYFLDQYHKGYIVFDAVYEWAYLAGVPVTVGIQIPSGSWNGDTSIIKSVEIYASRPARYIETDEMEDVYRQYFIDLTDEYFATYLLPQREYGKMDLDNQLLYFQKSIPMDTLADGSVHDVDLAFGGNLQVTSKTLQVDAGAVTRYGNMLAYNARFHFFDSVSKTEIGMPFFLGQETQQTYLKHIYVVYNDGKINRMVFVGTKYMYNMTPRIVVAPSVRIAEVITAEQIGTSSSWLATRFPMRPSLTYNYSVYAEYGVTTETWANYSPGTPDDIVYLEEPEAVNVTEQYNPFVFNVKNSYLAPGKVLDVQPQMVAVQDVSYGDYPLDVFTNRGVYALLQGNGEVLYSAFRPVSNLVSLSNSISTESGTFFLAAGALWLMAGARAVLVSDALHLGPHKYIRSCAGFIKLSMGNGTSAQISGTYDVTNLLSDPEFREYVYGTVNNTLYKATLSYNRYRDELFISNPHYGYTYVLSLKYRQWFKIAGKYTQDSPGSDIVNTPGSTSSLINILDLTSEDKTSHVLVHLQSRPFSVGYQYTHVHRLLAMIRANLTSSESLIVALYGSDNLQDWNLLAYSRKTNVKISQVRTTSASRSWRYYTVCIGGTVPPDTDFGTNAVDYQPVVRRLG